MTDDDSWIELSAAIRNVVALLTNKKAASEGTFASEAAVSEAAGVQLTEGGTGCRSLPAVASMNSDVAGKTALAAPTRNPVPAVDRLTWSGPTAIPALPLVAFATGLEKETAPVDFGKTGRCPRNQHRCKLAALEFMTASDGRVHTAARGRRD